MKPTLRSAILNAVGLTLSVVPPIVATVSYFPIWREEGAASVISGFCLLLLLISALPLARYAARRLSSPSVCMLWTAIFLLFYFLGKIAEQMTVIALVGTISNILGAVLFRLARVRREHDEEK
jgi:Co/Zn/Cd efflux system component